MVPRRVLTEHLTALCNPIIPQCTPFTCQFVDAYRFKKPCIVYKPFLRKPGQFRPIIYNCRHTVEVKVIGQAGSKILKAEAEALHALIEGVQADAFPSNTFERSQANDIVPIIRQHKLCSYISNLASTKDGCSWLNQLADEQEHLRHLSEEVCACLARMAADSNLKIAIVKGLAFERSIYGSIHMRDIGDIDVLVALQDSEKLHEI